MLTGHIDGFAHSGLRGLGFAAGQYFSLGLERDADDLPPIKGQAFAGAIIEHDGQVLLREQEAGMCPPQLQLESPARIRATLEGWLASKGFDLKLGNAYSIFDVAESGDHFTYFRAEATNSNISGPGRYYPITDLPELDFVSPAHAYMLKRFAVEHQTQSFGLYLGDEREGELLNYKERK